MKIFRKHRAIAMMLILALFCSLFGCGFYSDMPFNGHITFHDLTITVPSSFIRDSTQSNEDLWVFETGGYRGYIILSRRDITGDTAASLDRYAGYLQEQGITAERETFMQMDAVRSSYTNEGLFCQEMLFAYNGAFYAIALRGGTEEDFHALLSTVGIER